MTIEAAKFKLKEAQFFLEHLRAEKTATAQPNKPAPENFLYYYSAFLSAAGSVKSILQDADPAWFSSSWRARLAVTEDKLQKFAVDTGNDSVHRGRVETKTKSEMAPVPIDYGRYRPLIFEIRAHALHLRQGGSPQTERNVHYADVDGVEQEIEIVCTEIISHLEKMVQDFSATRT
jgi:hypothetical protein